ncbi:MAG: SDR family NAD(P)-dependent oxidoreductase [Clostridiales bacterium]|nr:SDR family NAD(P)-dependent oxidoreductase [Clostridiales bacterium]
MKRNNIVIVGGSSGIGLSLSQKLEDREITVISKSPCPVAGVRNFIADVCSPKELKAAFSKIERIDALVYCAGTSLAAPVECVQTDDYRRLFDTNLLGAVECTRLAMPLLKSSGAGRIIYLGSMGGVMPIAFDSFYSASKAALMLFARAVNLETDKVSASVALIGGTQTRFSFKRKIYTDCGEYDPALKSASDALIKIEQTGYTADFVSDKLIKMIDNEKPAVVTIGLKYKFAGMLYKLLPQRIKHFADKKIYDI